VTVTTTIRTYKYFMLGPGFSKSTLSKAKTARQDQQQVVLVLQQMSEVEPLVLAHVIRDVLDSFTPTIPLRITYNNRLLLAGVELKPSAVVNKPRVDVGGTDLRVFYTLVSK